MNNSPFSVINNEPENVRNKFLNGMPNQDNYPGMFPGTNSQQNQNYFNFQNNAIQNYNEISQYPLENNYQNYFGYKNSENNGIEEFRDENLTNPCNQSGFGKIIPEFKNGNPLLDIENRPISQFSHNNMVPFYGAKLTQNMRGTGVPQAGANSEYGNSNETPYNQKLAAFTGCDETYKHKREIPNMFSPVEGIINWVFGMPNIEPDKDRYTDSLWRRHGEKPVESIQVGPGIGIDYTVPAEGGFHQFNRIMPNNVNDYKMNQLENRINAGKWFVNHPTSQFTEGVSKNTPDLTITQARRPTMQSKFYGSAPSADNSGLTNYTVAATKGKQSRSDADFGFGNYNCEFSEAPVGMTMGSIIPKDSQERNSYNTIRETFKRGNPNCLQQEQGSNEWGLIMGPASGVNKAGIQRNGYYVNLTDRGNANPFVINASGTASGAQHWSPNSYQQDPRTTRKETMEFSYQGNLSSATGAHTQNTWQDSQKVTKRETTEFSYQGNASIGGGIGAHTQNTWQDDQKVTKKETTSFSHNGNLSGNTNFTNRFMFEGDSTIEHYTHIIPDIEEAKPKKFRKGGMTSNNLRDSANVTGYFPGAGRQNIIPDAMPGNEKSISSIGSVRYNGIGESISGPGTLLSSNVQIGGGTGVQVSAPNEGNQGKVQMNDKREHYVDYRHTDPFVIENLRNNPLSVYAVGNAKTAEIPQFFVDSKPTNFNTYISENTPNLSEDTVQELIDGSPQVNILNLDNNPFMGSTHRPNETAFVYNKGYSGDATESLKKLTNTMWKGNHFQNKSLTFLSPGYNVAPQINKGCMVEDGSRTNLPWGPRNVTGNPQTQLGGIWPKSE